MVWGLAQLVGIYITVVLLVRYVFPCVVGGILWIAGALGSLHEHALQRIIDRHYE